MKMKLLKMHKYKRIELSIEMWKDYQNEIVVIDPKHEYKKVADLYNK